MGERHLGHNNSRLTRARFAATLRFAIWIAMTWNFFLNRNFTFSYARRGSLLRQYLGFCGSCLVGAVANWSTSVTLCALNSFFLKNKILAAIAGVAAGMIFNFLLCRLVVFRDSRPRSPAGESQAPAASDPVERQLASEAESGAPEEHSTIQ